MEQPWLILPLCKLLPMLLQMPALHYYMGKLKNINLAREKKRRAYIVTVLIIIVVLLIIIVTVTIIHQKTMLMIIILSKLV